MLPRGTAAGPFGAARDAPLAPAQPAGNLEGLTGLLEALPSCMVLLDADGTVLFANAAARALLGDDVLTGPDLRQLFPDGRPPSPGPGWGGWTSEVHFPGDHSRVIECVPSTTVQDGRSLLLLTLRDVSAARESTRKASALARIAASMTYAGTLEATLDALARSVVEATGMAACLVWVLEDGHRLRIAGTYGFPDGYNGALEGIARSGVALASMQALEERRALVFPDSRAMLLREAGFAPLHRFLADAPWDTLVCLPLIFHDVPLGTLVAHFHRDAAPDEAALSFLGAIADQAAVAVENARLVAAQAAEALAERQQAQALVQQKETQYRAIFEATSDGMVIRDLDGRAVEMNPAYCAMHGYSREEMLRLPPSSHVLPAYHGAFAEFLETLRWGGTYRTQAVDVRQDGTPFHVDVRGTPIIYQGKPHVLGIVRDITEQVEAYRLLEQRVEERTRELSTVLEVSHDMASTLELQPLLGLILAHLRTVVDYRDANVMLLEGDDLRFLDYWGPLASEHMIGRRFPLKNAPANLKVVEGRAPVIIPDIWDDGNPLARSFRQVGEQDLDNTHSHFTAWMGVPLIHKERVIGMLGLSHTVAGYFTERHARLALAIANHAAVAMENARLYSRAQQVAALEERARLARELHDSVSQALYGIALGARTAHSLLTRDPSKVAEPLDYVLSLAEAGLTEMRALIFALRPESLATEGLVVALEHQAAALRSRYELEVDASLGKEPETAYEVKEALYRIAQEALHNTVKHARARRVRVSLEDRGGCLTLGVEDDGAGFDTRDEFRGHLGLRSMRERAESLGGRLTVESAPGKGTRLAVSMPAQSPRP